MTKITATGDSDHRLTAKPQRTFTYRPKQSSDLIARLTTQSSCNSPKLPLL
ncbi:hypothetical protein SynA1825c_02835 [Synechococcus sp. A18-25c]|nr:hypothetical protein SynA1825c_02835 [Synechococcus sp. A18-25c]